MGLRSGWEVFLDKKKKEVDGTPVGAGTTPFSDDCFISLGSPSQKDPCEEILNETSSQAHNWSFLLCL